MSVTNFTGGPACIHCAKVAQVRSGVFVNHQPGLAFCEYDPRHREIEEPIDVASCLAFWAHLLKSGIEAARGRGFDIDEVARDEARRWMEDPTGTFAFGCELFDLNPERLVEQERHRWRRSAA